MKKKIIFCLLSLSLMIAGCQSNEIEDITPPSKEVQLSPEELLSIRYKSSPELSQTEVFNLLTTFQSSELKNNAHSRITFQPNIFQIKEKYYLSKNKADARNIESTEEQIPIYKIEFTSETGTGMAVVSGDRRAPHILAYIDNIKKTRILFTQVPTLCFNGAKCTSAMKLPNLMRLKIHCMNLLF